MGINFTNEMTDGTLSDLGIEVSFRDQITMQLRGNHYPPVPYSMVDVCIEAIEACNEDDSCRLIQLPTDGLDRNGEPFQITWRGSSKAPAWAIVEGHHLQAWVDSDDDYYEED